MRRGTSGAGSHLNWLFFTKLSEELLPYWESNHSLIHLYWAPYWTASFSNHTKIIWLVFVKFYQGSQLCGFLFQGQELAGRSMPLSTFSSIGDGHIQGVTLLLEPQGKFQAVSWTVLTFIFSSFQLFLLKSRLVKDISKSKRSCLEGRMHTSSMECQLEGFSMTVQDTDHKSPSENGFEIFFVVVFILLVPSPCPPSLPLGKAVKIHYFCQY